jgi:predicted nucleotidyltransferase
LQKVREVVEAHGRKLLALIVFGSAVREPRSARDIDLLVVVDEAKDAGELAGLGQRIRSMLLGELRLPLDVVVLDLESLESSAVPGTLVSSLVLGYCTLHDEVGVERIVGKVVEQLVKHRVILYWKKGRTYDLTMVAQYLGRLRALCPSV